MYADGASLAYKVDHVGVCFANAERGFNFCRDALQLPVAWRFAHNGPAHTGGIGLGNLNLEFLDATTVAMPVHDPAALGLVAFQRAPQTDDALLAALDARQVEHANPTTRGDEVFGFTNIGVSGLGPDLAFFCGYHYPGAHDNAVRHAELAAVAGGPLTLDGVTEIRAHLALTRCAELFGASDSGRWTFDTGPDLVADSSIEVGAAEMQWSVRDADRAARVLVDLGAIAEGDTFAIPELNGLRISLTDAPAARPANLAARRAQAEW